MGDDILSGGRVDPSTSGPNPPNRDDRGRDILSEQKEKQDQDAIGGTQFPPRPQPLPPIPEAPEVAPPLPIIPSFDFSISGAAIEETREIARQTVVDVLKNVTINGQSPSFEGSTISFNIPQQPPASEAFIFQGIMVPQPLPQVQPIQPPVLPMAQPEPVQEIRSFVVSPPSRRAEQQAEGSEPTQEREQPSQPSAQRIQEPALPAAEMAEPVRENPSVGARPTPSRPTPVAAEEIQPPQEPIIPTVEPVRSSPVPEAPSVGLSETTSQETAQPTTETPRQQPPQQARTEPVQEPEAPDAISPASAPEAVSVPKVRMEAVETEEPESPVSPRTTATTPPPIAEGEVEQAPERPATEAPPTPEAPQPPSIEFLEPTQPTTTMVESDVVRPTTEISVESSEPRIGSQKPQPARPQEEPEGAPATEKTKTFEEDEFRPRYGHLSNYPTFEGGTPQDQSQEIRDNARNRDADISFEGASETRAEARGNKPDISFDIASENREEARTSTAATSAEEATEQANKRRKEGLERAGSNASIDRESPIRQRGESVADFRERQEELKKERAEEAKQAKILKRAREGDISELPSGMIPVRLTRADDQKKILALMATEFVGVVEGGTAEERIASLPSEDSYYIAAGEQCAGLRIYSKTVGPPENRIAQVWVSAGTINGELPDGFDPIGGKMVAESETGFVWIQVDINPFSGLVLSSSANAGFSIPENEEATFYYGIGSYEYQSQDSVTIQNYGCGSITAAVCRNWYTIEQPFYSVYFFR